jgi:hypothetical protein
MPFTVIVSWEGCVSLLDHVYGTGEAVVHREPEGTEAHPVGRSYTIWPIRGPGYLLALSGVHSAVARCIKIPQSQAAVAL